MPHPSHPSASVVIEWENVQLAEADRCTRMLAELVRQVADVPSSAAGGQPGFEILLVHDDQKTSAEEIRAFCRAAIPVIPANATVRFVASRGLGYYEQKNRGARESTGPIVVFLDSDVIPEPGWLAAILDSFADPAVDVVCGNCYLDASDLVSRTMALAWFFPLRETGDDLRCQDSFFANNVAFRREVILRHPFVPLPGTSRGACRLLARELTAAGVGLFGTSAARVSHPAPHGLRHLLTRGAAQGRDNLLLRRHLDGGTLASSLGRWLRLQVRGWRRIVRDGRRVGLTPMAVPAAIGLATLYYACYLAGDILARAAPRWTARHITLEG